MSKNAGMPRSAVRVESRLVPTVAQGTLLIRIQGECARRTALSPLWAVTHNVDVPVCAGAQGWCTRGCGQRTGARGWGGVLILMGCVAVLDGYERVD